LGARDGHLGRGTPTTRRRRARDRVPRAREPLDRRRWRRRAIPAGGEGEEGELEDGAAGGSGPGDIPEDEVEYFEVEFVKQGETVELSNNEPILDQGEDQGWDLPYACRQGQCVSCAGRIADGPSEDFVEHDNQQMLEDAEIEDGYTLTCVAYPRGSFSIETGEAP